MTVGSTIARGLYQMPGCQHTQVHAVQRVSAWLALTFAVATPFQHAAVAALGAPDEYYAGLRANYLARRDRMCEGLADCGFAVRPPEGTYFALADIRPLGYDDDETFCRTLVERVGVAAIPTSAFTAAFSPFSEWQPAQSAITSKRYLPRASRAGVDSTLMLDGEAVAGLRRTR